MRFLPLVLSVVIGALCGCGGDRPGGKGRAPERGAASADVQLAALGKATPPVARDRVRDVITDPQVLNGPLGELAALVNSFVLLRDTVVDNFEAVNERYRSSPTDRDPNRWRWLAASREAIGAVDRATPEVAVLEAEFRGKYAACPAKTKIELEDWADKMARFWEHRLRCRYSWYYIASAHRWRWERESNLPPVNARLVESASRGLGCTPEQGRRLLAWIDLLATDLLPGSLRQILTIPLAFMS